MKIASWNVNSLRVRLPQVLEWLEDNQVDVLALQETKMVDKDFPVEEIQQAGYQVQYSGQK
ncbi:MAG: endonuclease/exonuclease/phosphatase family protein, partial [Gammaproteobacteria bacterium]